MISTGQVISYLEMCQAEGVNLQKGMNFRLHNRLSVILMSVQPGAPYVDEIKDNGSVLIYEGHDRPHYKGSQDDPKALNQPMYNPSGSLTENGKFYEAAKAHKDAGKRAELVKVYEKIRPGIWTFNGIFKLVDAEIKQVKKRNVQVHFNFSQRRSIARYKSIGA